MKWQWQWMWRAKVKMLKTETSKNQNVDENGAYETCGQRDHLMKLEKVSEEFLTNDRTERNEWTMRGLRKLWRKLALLRCASADGLVGKKKQYIKQGQWTEADRCWVL